MNLQKKSSLIACLVSLCLALTFAENTKQPIGKLIIFDPATDSQIVPVDYSKNVKPEIKTRYSYTSTITKFIPLPKLWNPCKCSSASCDCCIGLRFSYTNTSKNGMCASLTSKRPELGANIRIDVNNITVVNKDVEDTCVPIPLLGLSFVGCLQISQFRFQENSNVEFCLSFDMKLKVKIIYGYKFGCFRFGANGPEMIAEASPPNNGPSMVE